MNLSSLPSNIHYNVAHENSYKNERKISVAKETELRKRNIKKSTNKLLKQIG